MRYLLLFLILFVSTACYAQTITADELLNKSIAFHNPNNQWENFNGAFKVLMNRPNSSERVSIIKMDLPKQQFSLEVQKDNVTYSYVFDKEECTTSLNGSSEISDEDRKTFRLTCERGKMMKNYYTYLYGLPMKLKDPGTILDSAVQTKTFKGKEYLVLKVNYEEGVGKDVWYFYFDPNTYAMEVYQFYHDQSKNDGEYILLEGLEEINGVKMPKTRAWYYNKDNKYLATDILLQPETK
ncbi:hypothetical protein DKG77_02240 [Flagellimonas aquimarina]|uniref:Aspartyl-tRNA synthetase n=1 Tax=Flagellimonas aquimarina TaxID=2201895 RepID=A0A316L1F3_9FLAO|nr:DUF6503 family protein [Allomuricauda koreensis]PWL39671.1 hypothetical protein DKG77_02240 [Allomuricauda koreensis]